MKIRKPAVAGSFYPADKGELIAMIREMDLQQPYAPKKQSTVIIGGIVPHAGYIYSGRIALPFFRQLAASQQRFETIIILHPNHYGAGPYIALDIHEAWETPIGITSVDLEISNALGFKLSLDAHRYEHSGEVMLPFLQYFLPYAFKIVPVALSRLDLSLGLWVADKINEVTKKQRQSTLVIASSDFSHFVSAESGMDTDNKAIRHIYNLDAEAFYKTVSDLHLSICGYAPIMTLIEYAKMYGKKTEIGLLARGHSGQVNFDDKVVHYLCMLLYESYQP